MQKPGTAIFSLKISRKQDLSTPRSDEEHKPTVPAGGEYSEIVNFDPQFTKQSHAYSQEATPNPGYSKSRPASRIQTADKAARTGSPIRRPFAFHG